MRSSRGAYRQPEAFSMTDQVQHFINGALTASKTGRFADVFNPASGEKARRVVLANAAEVNQAVEAADMAAVAWADTPPLTRARVMFKFKELIEHHQDDLAALITSEHGKVISDAKGEVTRG